MKESRVHYGPGGFDPTKPNANVVEQDEIEVEPEEWNRRQLHDRARAALAANAAYLAIPSPTAAKNAAQVRSLTRQMNALTRLTLSELDQIDGPDA